MRSLNILIAEDDPQNQAMMKLILVRRGHIVKSAWNGIQAFEAVKAECFDLVFMDLQMPEMGGLEATQHIRKWENEKRHVPIVILSASVPQHVIESYRAVGADTFLNKPFDLKRLDSLLSVISSEPACQALGEPASENIESQGNLPTLEEQEALMRFGGDRQGYAENLNEFMMGLSTRIERISEALSEKQWEELSILAHNLKGVAANFGARQLSALANRLDEDSQKQKFSQAQITFQEINKHIFILIEAAGKVIDQKQPKFEYSLEKIEDK